MSHDDVGDLANIVVGVVFFGWLIWAWRRRKRPVDMVADEPPGRSYRVFTREHDLTLPARAVPAALRNDGADHARGWALADLSHWHRRIEAARAARRRLDPDGIAAATLAQALAPRDDVAIAMLIDHSGSMAGGRIVDTAAAVRWLAERIDATPLGILGFSTVGWEGGRARRQWLWNGQPKRPGRLCALLHIVFKDFTAPMASEDWDVLLHPDILRENVDGEALRWAADLLQARPEAHRIMVVVSDGAPVDDATLALNGPSYLDRHLRDVVSAIAAEGAVTLVAIGIEYDVAGYYSSSVKVDDLAQLPAAFADVIGRALMPGAA